MGNLNDGTLRLDPHWRGQDWRLWGRNAVIHDGLVKMKSAAEVKCPKVWARWPDPEVALVAERLRPASMGVPSLGPTGLYPDRCS